MLLGGALAPDPRVVLGDTRRALPFSVLVDRHGRIVRTRLGALDPADPAPLAALNSRRPGPHVTSRPNL